MLRFSLIVILFIALLGCDNGSSVPATAPNPSPASTAAPEETPALTTDDRTYVPGERVGLITKGMTAEDVQRAYGADNFVATTLYGPEGISYAGFHLFPGTDDELNVAIDAEGFSADTYNPGSHWTSSAGVRVGTSLEELVRLNGGPFSFSGFGWDYGGNVTDWRGGALDGHAVRLVYDYNFVDREDRAFTDNALGDRIVSSDNTVLADKGIRVTTIYVGSN